VVTARLLGVLLAVAAAAVACGGGAGDETARPVVDAIDDTDVVDPAAAHDADGDAGPSRATSHGADDGGSARETDEAEPQAEPQAERETEPQAERQADPQVEPQAEPPRRNVIAWILGLGPSAPTGPSAFRAYGLLVDGDCQGVLDRFAEGHPEALRLGAASEELYRAAASACLAAFHGRPDLWAAAETDTASTPVGDGSCLDRAVGEMLVSLVAAHRDDPAAGFERAGGTGSTPPCPTITQLSPPRGPPGTVVRISGDHLDAAQLEVHLVVGGPGSVAELVPRRDGSDLLVTIDGVDGPASVCLALHTVPDWYAAGATFELEALTEATDEGADVEDTDAASEPPAARGSPPPVTCPPVP
jgi:hypothetical protein